MTIESLASHAIGKGAEPDAVFDSERGIQPSKNTVVI